MDILDLVEGISEISSTKIIMLAIDGLGGLPDLATGKTELETAKTPNLDSLATKGSCGLMDPVGPGIIPGSVPGHLAIFGFDPLIHNIGRGAMEAIGINFDLQAEDIVARGNFATITKDNIIDDRRAGRLSTEKAAELCHLMDGINIGDTKIIVRPVKDYRFIVVFRGNGLASGVTDSDPQQIGVTPKRIVALNAPAEKTADVANKFIGEAKTLLNRQSSANMILLRGFSKRPAFPSINEIYKIKSAAISAFPMYRGLASLVGMEAIESGNSIDEALEVLERRYRDFNFISLHIKQVDTAGEDGDFDRKVTAIEQVDKAMERIQRLNADVIVITSDHSTPATMALHSWHPVPVLIYSRWCRPDKISKFSEYNCRSGGLGRFPAINLMPLVMAHALKLGKFGA